MQVFSPPAFVAPTKEYSRYAFVGASRQTTKILSKECEVIYAPTLSFHAQQAAEKAIKAVLVFEGIDFPKTHNIEFLLTLLPAHVPHAPILMQVYQLTGYATIFRYPGDEEPLSRGRHQELLIIARETVAWAVAVIE